MNKILILLGILQLTVYSLKSDSIFVNKIDGTYIHTQIINSNIITNDIKINLKIKINEKGNCMYN